MTNILFICSMNQWRSPTAEKVFQKEQGIAVRSAGTVRGAKRTVSVEDIRWSDIILVMEDKHKSRLLAQFRDEVRYKALHVLDIPDEYKYMDPELVEIIRETATPIILDARP
ncbi:MAG: protein tyrosine phosphatase [Pseudomonadota bacterium]